MKQISPFFWFNNQAEEAAQFYTSVFKNSKITNTSYYPEVGKDITGQNPGSVMTVSLTLNCGEFTFLNGGPHFKFSQAISFVVPCDTQDEIDDFWNKLSQGGEIQQCGWLLDKYGVAWQIVPSNMAELASTPEKTNAVMAEVFKMKKLDKKKMEDAAHSATRKSA